MALTVIDYLNKKNKWVEFPIVSISAIPNYVSGSKSLRIYFAFDDTYDDGKYAYPDYPDHLLNSRYRLGDVSYYSASIDPSWFNVVGDTITFEGGSYMRCNRVNVNGPSRFGTNTKSKEILFYAPNVTNLNASSGNCYVVTSSEKRTGITTLMTEAYYNLGGLLSVRMILKDWNDVLNAYKAYADGTSILTKGELSDKFNIRTNETYTCVYSSELQNRFANSDSGGLGINTPSSYRRGLDYDMNKGGTVAKRTYNFLVGLGEGKMVVGGGGHGETSGGKDPSTPSGGDGNYDGSYDNNDNTGKDSTSDLHSTSLEAGLKTYILNETALNGFHDFMFADAFNSTWDSIRKVFGKPQDCIVGFNALYIPDITNAPKNIAIGNLDTGVSAGIPTSQWVQIDCGTVHVDEAWGSFLDYPPFTSASLYLPFCGTIELPVNEIMNADVSITYNIDITTGSCVASVYSHKEGDGQYKPSIDATIARTQGNIGMQIPWSAADASRQWSAIGQIAAVAVATAVSSGTLAVAATSAGSAGVATATTSAVGAAEGATAGGIAAKAGQAAASSFIRNAGVAGATVLNNVGYIPYATVTRGGTAQNVFGVLQYFTPYLLITRPIQSYPDNYRHYHGLPCNITTRLSELDGYTQVAAIELDDLEGITPTEIAMLHETLTTGFYI